MRDLLFFAGGFAAGLWFIYGTLRLELWRERRDKRKEVVGENTAGVTVTTVGSTTMFGGGTYASVNVSQRPNGNEGGGQSQPPPLRVIKGGEK